MKRGLILFFIPALTAVLCLQSCKDANAVIDLNTAITDHNWSYLNKIDFTVKIDDEKAAYNLFMNLRVTDNYKYSNMFVLIVENGPDKKPVTRRYELKLANKDGEWLGKGSGNLYSYQLPFETRYKFPAKGTYHFALEQNMRDNPLREVSDVGLKVQKVK